MSEGLRQMSPKDGYVVNTKAHIGSTEFKVILKLLPAVDGGQCLRYLFIISG